MNEGKLSEIAFKRSVLPVVKRINGTKENSICMRTAVVTGNEEGVAKLAVTRALNALAAVPAEAMSVAISISIPAEFPRRVIRFDDGPSPDQSENAMKAVMAEIEKALEGKDLVISDLVSEVTENTKITVVVTACGTEVATRQPALKNIVMVGLTGAAGSAMLSINHKDGLGWRYNRDFLAGSDKLFENIDISNDVRAVLSAENNKTVIWPVSDGGVFGAIWSLCAELDMGCEIEIKDIPIKQVTIEVTESFDLNPYRLRGDGAFLYVTEKDAEAVTIGKVIGHLTKNADRVVINEDTRSFLTPVREDSYFDYGPI